MRNIKSMVVAGNMHEFHRWCLINSFDPKNYQYISRQDMAYGLPRMEIICVGTYYKRDDLNFYELSLRGKLVYDETY